MAHIEMSLAVEGDGVGRIVTIQGGDAGSIVGGIHQCLRVGSMSYGPSALSIVSDQHIIHDEALVITL